MARIRTVKPALFKDEELCDLPIEARYLFIGLFTQADRAGRLEDRPKLLKLEIFPWDTIEVPALLALLDGRFITRYEVDGKKYIQINNFLKHQRPHPKEPDSEIVEKHGETRPAVEKSGKTGGKGREGKGMDTGDGKEGDAIAPETPAPQKPAVCRKPFVRPALDEVAQYCRERASSVNPERFLAYYESNGWCVGRNPMKDWKAAIRTWELKENGNQAGFGRGSGTARIVGAAKPVPGKYDHLDQ